MPETHTPARESVRRDLDRNAIPVQHAEPEPPRVDGHGRKHYTPAGHGAAKGRDGEGIDDRALELNRILFRHRVYNGLTHELASTTRLLFCRYQSLVTNHQSPIFPRASR